MIAYGLIAVLVIFFSAVTVHYRKRLKARRRKAR